MTTLVPFAFNPELDLKLVRVVPVTPEKVWAAYTTPALLKQWFCPRPWSVSDCILDLRPGGRFFTEMRSPEGEAFPNDGCYLELVPNQRLVFTSTMGEGFRPAAVPVNGPNLLFTAVVTIEPEGTGTRYTAHVMHADPGSQKMHAEMGFEGGWGAALDQLVELMSA